MYACSKGPMAMAERVAVAERMVEEVMSKHRLS
jgi:hypothetical protein